MYSRDTYGCEPETGREKKSRATAQRHPTTIARLHSWMVVSLPASVFSVSLTSKRWPISARLFSAAAAAAAEDDVDSAAALSWRAALVPTAFDMTICQPREGRGRGEGSITA